MKLRILGALAMFWMSTSLAQAAFDATAVGQQYLDQGYTRVEIKLGPTQAKVEAIKDSTKIEVIYDIATGDVLKSETGPVDGGDSVSPGVFVQNRDRDFASVGSSSDDDGADDNDENDDNGGSSGSDDDGEDDDNSGSNSGSGGVTLSLSGSGSGGEGSDDEDDDHNGNSGSGGGDDESDDD